MATHKEISRLFPALSDHAILEIEAMRATVDELDAAMLMLRGEDEALVDVRRRDSGRLQRLIAVLHDAGVGPTEDRDDA